MSFTPKPCYSVTSEVRKKCRSIFQKDFSDEQVNNIQNQVFSSINIRMHRSGNPLPSDDPDYPAVVLVETNWTVGELAKYYGGLDETGLMTAQALIDSAKEDLDEAIGEGDITPDDTDETIEHTARKSWGLDPTIPIPSKLQKNLHSESTAGTSAARRAGEGFG